MLLQSKKMETIGFSNIDLDVDRSYAIYMSLSYSLSQPLPNLLSGLDPIFISQELPGVVPDNFVWVPSGSGQKSRNISEATTNYLDLFTEVSKSPYLSSLFRELVGNQGGLVVNSFCSDPSFLEFSDVQGLEFLGGSEALDNLGNKCTQYRLLDSEAPVPSYVVGTPSEHVDGFRNVSSEHGIFTSRPYSRGGRGTKIFVGENDFLNYLGTLPSDEEFIVAECLDVVACPSIDVLVANEDEILVYGITELVLNGLSCVGGRSPREEVLGISEELRDMAFKVGRAFAREGFYGNFNIDTNLDSNGRLFFGEANLRYGGLSSERILSMELNRPGGSPTLIDLKAMATRNRSFGGFNLWKAPEDLFWYKMELKAKKEGYVVKDLTGTQQDELTLFRNGGSALIGALEKGRRVLPGAKLGKIVCVSDNESDLQEEIARIGKNVEGILNSSV